jgi:hypothetical protein
MCKSLKYFTAISLSALLVLSTISFTVDMHFCGRHLVDFAINDKAHGCGMSMDDVADSPARPGVVTDMGCCQNVNFTVTGQDDLQVASADYSIIHPVQFQIPAIYPPMQFDEAAGEAVFYPVYQPPPRFGDFLVLYQVFRI